MSVLLDLMHMFRLAFNLGVEDIALLSGDELNASSNYLVFLNGCMLGITSRSVMNQSALPSITQPGVDGRRSP